MPAVSAESASYRAMDALRHQMITRRVRNRLTVSCVCRRVVGERGGRDRFEPFLEMEKGDLEESIKSYNDPANHLTEFKAADRMGVRRLGRLG